MTDTTTAPARTGLQAIMLHRLDKEFGVDTSPAAPLSGTALDAWIDAAGDELFEREYAEFKAQRAAMQLQT